MGSLSSAGNAQPPTLLAGELGEGGACLAPSPCWPLSGLAFFLHPLFCVFRACGPQEGLTSDLPELHNLTSLWCALSPPTWAPPSPASAWRASSSPPQSPLPALSIRRFSQDAPITSPRPPCGPWNDWSVTSAGGSGVSPREFPVPWPDATWRSMSVTHVGAEPAERRRLMARVDIWRGSRGRGPGLWPGRAARGRRAPAPWARGFPRASRAPSQPWPCAWPQPHPFLPARPCWLLGGEHSLNVGQEGQRPGEGRARTEGVEGGQWLGTPTRRAHAVAPRPPTPAPVGKPLPGLDQHGLGQPEGSGPISHVQQASPGAPPSPALEPPHIGDPELQEPLCVSAPRSRGPSGTSCSSPATGTLEARRCGLGHPAQEAPPAGRSR